MSGGVGMFVAFRGCDASVLWRDCDGAGRFVCASFWATVLACCRDKIHTGRGG